jgi:hypothetical protein
MKLITKCAFAVATVAVLLPACKQTQSPKVSPAQSAVKLKQLAVPKSVFSIAGEVLAYQAIGETGKSEDLKLSLRELKSRVGGFNRVFVYEYGADGKVLSPQEMKLDFENAIAIKAAPGRRYLIYPDLGERFRNTYELACRIKNARIAPQARPRLCTQIFCTNEPFRVSDIIARVPELKGQVDTTDLGDGLMGGLRGSGSICEKCLQPGEPNPGFIPARGCSGEVPFDPNPPNTSDQVVFQHVQFDDDVRGNFQIFKMNDDGSDPVNLSNTDFSQFSPDVQHRTKRIAFVSMDTAEIGTMNLNGGNRQTVPNTFGAGQPRWSRKDESFIIFTSNNAHLGSALVRIRPDGTDRVQITTPGDGEIDDFPDMIDDQKVIFVRMNATTHLNDLFVQDIFDGSPAVRITNTVDDNERFPVVAHNDSSLFAFSTQDQVGGGEVIIVARLHPAGLTVLHIFQLQSPAQTHIGGIDFSTDDKRLYVSTLVDDVLGDFVGRKVEIFSMNLDGTDQFRLTINTDTDDFPSVV